MHFPGGGHNFTAETSVGVPPALAVQATFASTASSAAKTHSVTPKMTCRTDCNSNDLTFEV